MDNYMRFKQNVQMASKWSSKLGIIFIIMGVVLFIVFIFLANIFGPFLYIMTIAPILWSLIGLYTICHSKKEDKVYELYLLARENGEKSTAIITNIRFNHLREQGNVSQTISYKYKNENDEIVNCQEVIDVSNEFKLRINDQLPIYLYQGNAVINYDALVPEQEEIDLSNTLHCPQCGKLYSDEEYFCSICGCRLK